MDDEPPPSAPFTPEDGAYQLIVSEYLGLQRAGADPLGAALITAAHLAIIAMANGGARPEPEQA